MISYKIITQELYDNLAKLSLDFPSQKAFLIQSNTELISKVQQFRGHVTILEVQLKEEKQKSHDLFSQLTHLESKLNQMSQKLAFQSGMEQKMDKLNIETTVLLENALNHKNQILAQNSDLISRLGVLQSVIIRINQKNERYEQKQKLLQSRIQELNQTIHTQNAQNLNLNKKLHQRQQALGKVNFQINKNAELLQKVLGQYDVCKEEKLELETELQKLKESPIPKLQQKITANETWIVELTKTINELSQRCVELEMDRRSYPLNTAPSFPYHTKTPMYLRPSVPYSPPVVAPYVPKLSAQNQKVQAVPNTTQQTFFTYKSRFDETQRLKYMAICKQLFQQFNTKLSKIQQQKKTMQEKFQSLKLKLNDYQYNEFKYKDRISMYLQKIKRYEKLTEKQQSEMQNLILEFDQELDNVVKMKEEEVRSKLQEEVSKYQTELQRLKEEEELTKKLEEQAYQELIKHQTIGDSFDNEMLKQLIEQTGNQLAQKSSELESLRNQVNKKSKELQKYKESKQSYKQKALALEQQCHENSTQIRRLKGLIQELIQELQTKSTENLMLKSTLQNRDVNLTNRSNNQDSRLRYGEEFNQNLSGKVSLNKNVSAGKRSGSEKFEYQFSQIDVELQRRNDMFLNQIVIKTRQEFQNFVSNTAAGPSRVSQHSDQAPNSQPYWTRGLKPSVKDSQESIKHSQISCQEQKEQQKQKDVHSGGNSPNSSVSSKNSYQSYGMRSLYRQKTNTIQSWGNRFLQHKNSLQ